jgi:hypothetical protein
MVVRAKPANGKRPGTQLFYPAACCGGKSVFVRQLRGPHLSISKAANEGHRKTGQRKWGTTGFGVELSDSEHESPQPVPSISLCEPFREAIELGLSQGRNAIGIWQDLVSESGFNGGYQTVKRFVRKLRGNQPPQPQP